MLWLNPQRILSTLGLEDRLVPGAMRHDLFCLTAPTENKSFRSTGYKSLKRSEEL